MKKAGHTKFYSKACHQTDDFFPNKKCMYWRHLLWLCCLLPVLLGSVQVSSNNVTIMNGARTKWEDMPTNQILSFENRAGRADVKVMRARQI